jgi:signal transduction histidine kinase
MMEQSITPTHTEILTSHLPANDALLKSIALGGPGLVAIVRYPDMKLIFVNDQFGHYLGYTNDDLGDVCFTDLLEAESEPRFISQLQHVRNEIAARSSYCLYSLKDRLESGMQYYLYASPLQQQASAEQDDLFYLMLQPDLSKWGMPFTSFETKELFLEQFEGEDFGTFEWLMDADKVYWSEGVYRIFEVDKTTKGLNHHFVKVFVHPNDKERVTNVLNETMANGGSLDIEFKILTAEKNVKVIHSLARVIRDGTGKQLKFTGSIRDVTNQRSIENDLKNKVEELNHSNRELEEFAYVASHDMQEPLRKITTFSDRLREKYKDVLSGDGAMYLTRMMASADNMRNLINDLLEFSRITKSVVPFTAVALDKTLAQVKTDLELIIEETGTVIKSAQLPVISAVASQMKQLFVNIINNAIKFHKPDVSPVITIESTVLGREEQIGFGLDANSRYYKIEISDNGIGFEPEYASRIFQVFQRLHGKSEYPGSGIGLAICKKIVEYHNGVIYAESQQGIGALFTIILPEHHRNGKENKI